jgi:hypothetical protein
MPHRTARPAGGIPDRAGLNDFRWAAESEASLYLKSLQAQASRRLQRQRHVERIHGLGARAFFELIDELDREHLLGDDLDRRLERFAALDPELLHAFGGDQFAASPVRVAEGAR